MFSISYFQMIIAISAVWIFVRTICIMRRKRFDIQRELRLLLVYACLLLVARFTFFPFTRHNGQIPPLEFDRAKMFPLRLNFVPFSRLRYYPSAFSVVHNLIGNTMLFIPVGVVWPAVFKQLNTYARVIAAGIGLSILIEILQLPFHSRFTDIDDLILNTAGYLLGYAFYRKGRKPTAK